MFGRSRNKNTDSEVTTPAGSTAWDYAPLLSQPNWYSALYGLAAHRAHLALHGGERGKSRSSELDRAREEALLLALGCVARLRAEANSAWAQELRDLESRLFKTEVAQAAMTVRPPPPTRIPARFAVRRDATAQQNSGALTNFITKTVQPSAFILLAGIEAAMGRTNAAYPERSTDDDLYGDLKKAATSGVGPDPARLVDAVLANEPLDSRVNYNVACYYAQTGQRELAQRYLTAAARGTHGAEHVALAAWAWKDPSLASAVHGWSKAEEVLGSRPGAAPEHELPELQRIAAIGGFAATLATHDIHSPERLRKRLQEPDGIAAISKLLEVHRELIEPWLGLLELIEIDGIGPAQVNLLEAVGVRDAESLRRWKNVDDLRQRLYEVNKARKLVAAVPSVDTLKGWQKVNSSRRRSSSSS